MKTKTNPLPPEDLSNKLWQARMKAGLERKQVAKLLSYKTTDTVSRYEKGINLPTLKNALKLEIIYRLPLRLLFQDHFQECQKEIEEIRKNNPTAFPDSLRLQRPAQELQNGEYCFYTELLKNEMPSEIELQIVTKHTINLSNTISDLKQRRKPFSSP